MTTTPRAANIQWQQGYVTRAQRQALHGHPGVVLWLTGLSGSGKSTLARGLERALVERGCSAYVLDGDNVRHGLNRDLGLSSEDRGENIRRIGEVAKLFVDAGLIVLCALVSPYREDRDRVRQRLGAQDFVEIYVRASVEACRSRDPKGLYARADAGEITDLTGVSAPYEPPEHPELVLDTEQATEAECLATALGWLVQRGYVQERSDRDRSNG
jgi:adenylylsulfate kinase